MARILHQSHMYHIEERKIKREYAKSSPSDENKKNIKNYYFCLFCKNTKIFSSFQA